MKKYVFLMIAIFFVAKCANLDFVYNTDKEINDLIKNTNLVISGDESNEVYAYIIDILDSTSSKDSKYKLSINSVRTELAQIIEKDATASKFSIEYNISYNLYNLKKNCEIVGATILTKSSYDSKSAGYSFGSDLSKKETEKKIISRNVDQFIASLKRYGDLNNCNNEN